MKKLFVFSVIFKVLSVFALISFAYAVDPPVVPPRRNENPCKDVAVGNIKSFVRDFASCQTYFWCNGPVATPTAPCVAPFIFDQTLVKCVEEVLGTNDCVKCPPLITIAVS